MALSDRSADVYQNHSRQFLSFLDNTQANFINGPSFLSRHKSIGDSVIIAGCQLQSVFPITNNDVYFVRNAFENINATVTSNKVMENLIIDLSSFQDHGFYQCGLFASKYMTKEIRSDSISLQFEGKQAMYVNYSCSK